MTKVLFFLIIFLAVASTEADFCVFFLTYICFWGFTIMGNAAGSPEASQRKESRSAAPGSTGPQKQTPGEKLPMPPEEELEERFSAVLVSRDVNDFVQHVNFNTEKRAQRNKECGICWKCARPQDKLIAVPGTQCPCGKIHKRSFIFELTAAWGLLFGGRHVHNLIRGAAAHSFSFTASELLLYWQCERFCIKMIFTQVLIVHKENPIKPVKEKYYTSYHLHVSMSCQS